LKSMCRSLLDDAPSPELIAVGDVLFRVGSDDGERKFFNRERDLTELADRGGRERLRASRFGRGATNRTDRRPS
jgi:hypothetical protein